MFLKQLIVLLAIAVTSFPAIANADEIDVRAGNVRITTDEDGDVRVYSRGRWQKNPYYRSYRDWDRYNRRNRSTSCSRGGSVVRQETTQVNRSGRTVTQSRTTYCR